MRVIGKDRTGCDACNPLDEIIARIEQLERRVVTIVARVQGIPPDGTGNVTLPTSDSVDGPLYGNIGAFAMSSEVKEATDDVHQYASAIADDVVVLQSDVEILTREVEALDPASVTALQQSVTALQQSVTQLSNTVAGYSAVIGDLEDRMPNKVDRTGDTMTGPLNVIDTATGSRNAQAVNGNRLQNDLDNYAPMIRTTGNQTKAGKLELINGYAGYNYEAHFCGGLNMAIGDWSIFAEIAVTSIGAYHIFEVVQGSNTSTCYGRFMLHEHLTAPNPVWIDLVNKGGNNPLTADSIAVLSDGTKLYLAWNKKSVYGSLICRETLGLSYGGVRNLNHNITWIPESERLVLPDTDGYTHFNIEVM